MARDRQRQGGPSTAPKFMTIISDPLDNTLKIPVDFCTRYWGNLPNRISLKVVGASVAEVGLIRSNDLIIINKGWKEFIERYSLGFGSLLVFEYTRASQFDVLIFSVTGSEIDYEIDHVPSVERLGKNRENIRGKRRRPHRDANHTSNPRSTPDGSLHSKVKLEQSISEEEQETSIGERAPTAYEKAESFTRARIPSLNPNFISKMRSSYINGLSLHIPPQFTRKYLPSTNCNLTIRLMNGESWRMKYTFGKCSRGNTYANIYCGWRNFVHDNALEVDDACLFEVTTKSELEWNVYIFRK